MVTPLQASPESANSITSTPLRKGKGRQLSYRKEGGQASLWNTPPSHPKKSSTLRDRPTWPQPSSFSTDLDRRCPVPPAWEVSSISGFTIFSVMSVSTVKVGSTMKSIKPAEKQRCSRETAYSLGPFRTSPRNWGVLAFKFAYTGAPDQIEVSFT